MRTLWTATTRTLLVTLFMLCAANSGRAQNAGAGEIRGTVTDPSGAMIPGVRVTLVEIDTGVTKQLTTNASGIYDAVSILPGTYRLTFTKEGFKELVRDGVVLNVGAITVDAQLTVGGYTQQVEVTGEATMLKTETGEQGLTLQKDTMAQLPNVGQDWTNFTKVLPGVTGTGASVSVNGNMPYNSNFLTDGGAITYPQSSNVDTAIFETVAEVQMNTSSFDAQYGIGGSVFNQISKSGTNRFHGAAYEYIENNFFNARDFFSPQVPNLRWNNYGGSIGGPIIKNKMFFYFNTDRTINNTTTYPFYTYATAAMKAGDFSSSVFPAIYDPATLTTVNGQQVRTPFPNNQIPGSRIDPMAAKIQTYFPVPNLPGVSNNWFQGLTAKSPLNRFFGRLDYNISDKHRLTGEVMERDLPLSLPNPDCPIDCQLGDVDAYHVQISEVWTISPTTVNEFRFSLARQGNWFTPETIGQGWGQKLGWQYAEADVPPSVTIGGPVGGMTWGGSAVNATLIETSFEPSDVVTMIKGKHIIKFGGEFLAEQDNSTIWGNVQSGQFTFSGVFTKRTPFDATSGLGYADFLLGQVASWNATNSPEVGVRMKAPQLFVQDDFKVLPNLTLNLGLRYQIQGGWSEVANRLGVFDPTIMNSATNTLGAMWFAGDNGRSALQAPLYNVVLPRFGFAWSPRNKWAVRGGFGIYSYLWSLDNYGENALGFGFGGSGSLANSDQLEPVFVLSNPNPSLNYVAASTSPSAYNGHAVNYYPYHTPLTRNYQWSFSIQRELLGNMVAEAAYVGSHGTGLSFPVDSNQVPADLLGPGDAQSRRPYPQFLGINGNFYNAISNYDSMQLFVRKRFQRGLSFDVNYTWEKMLDDQDSSGWGRIAGSPIYQDAYNPSSNYGYSNYDVPRMFKGDVVYQLPIGKGKEFLNSGGLLDALVGGWQASTIFTVESGTPFTPVMGTANLSGSAPNGNLYLAGFSAAESWYPNVVGNPSLPNPSIGEWFNTAAFAQPNPYTFGDSGRNILRGPGLTSVDFSMGKIFRLPFLGEAGQLQFRFDATNVLNHANFANPNPNIGTPAAGTITSTVTGAGRILQIGARLAF
ncbi:MAG: TonB-dependent receptor [Bryobacteraceae bacterium]